MQRRACVFVDGENLRYSLVGALLGDGFQPSEYLPPTANWAAFFDWIVAAATNESHFRLRAYWFVTEQIDCYPYALARLSRPENHNTLRSVLGRDPLAREQLKGLGSGTLEREMQRIVADLQERQSKIKTRFDGWTEVQHGIALRHRAIEFRRAGAISFNLFEEQFGQEKCVDVRLACDMLMLRDIYDTAIIVSGDQDYVPVAQMLKDAGKTVVNVAFEKRSGSLIPGGARRLNIVTDASIRVPYERLRAFMGADRPSPTRGMAPQIVASNGP